MKSMGILHYYKTGTRFKILDIIRQEDWFTEVLIYNHIVRVKQTRKVWFTKFNTTDLITLYTELKNVQVEGIDHRDAPDYVDAFISYAENKVGTPLSDDELEDISDSVVYEYVMKKLY